MSIPLQLDATTGNLARFGTGDALDINTISARNPATALTVGANLNSGQEVQLGNANADTRVLGDLFVNGSSTVTVDETITGTFNADGNVNLGTGNDTINLGGGAGDVINLNANLVVGAGTRSIGSSITDYLDALWLDAVNANGPALAAYDLNASGTNAGAYAIGVDPALVSSSTATDLMTMLADMDAAISGGASTLQATYQTGNTISVTSAEGTLAFSNDTVADTTTILTVSRAPASSTGGIGISVSMGANTTGTGLQINQIGSGLALDVQDNGVSVLQVTGAGAINLTPTSGQSLVVTVAGAGVIDLNAAGAITIDSSGAGISLDAAGASNFSTSSGNLTFDAAAGELVLDDVGNSGLTLSQSSDRTLAETSAGEVFSGVTSIIGLANSLAEWISVFGGPFTEDIAIANGVTLAAGDVVAQSTTSGRITQANGNAAANVRVIGICLVGGTGDVGGTVLGRVALPGSSVVDSGATFTAGAALFVPDGSGRPTATAPANDGDLVMRVGWARSTTEYIVDLGPAVVL